MKLNVTFKGDKPLKLKYGEVHKVTEYVGGELYEGTYSVTSKVDTDVILPTAKKVLEKDITVNKIPYAEVSNNTGGKTVTIG